MRGFAADANFEHRAGNHIRTHYSPVDFVLLFFLIALFGWLWEVALTWIQLGRFANRGVLLGPWLPLYGSGGILVLLALRRWFHRPGLTFLLSAALCTALEYACGWFLEAATGLRWWDYRAYRFHIQGRVSLEGALVFGLACCVVIYWVAPRLGALLDRMPRRGKRALALVLSILFCADVIHACIAPNVGLGVATPAAVAHILRL